MLRPRMSNRYLGSQKIKKNHAESPRNLAKTRPTDLPISEKGCSSSAAELAQVDRTSARELRSYSEEFVLRGGRCDQPHHRPSKARGTAREKHPTPVESQHDGRNEQRCDRCTNAGPRVRMPKASDRSLAGNHSEITFAPAEETYRPHQTREETIQRPALIYEMVREIGSPPTTRR